MKIKVYDMLGNEAGEMELSDSIFGAQINVPLMHEMVKNYLANRRHGTQSTLTRSEVSGGGKKPWRQKGTGRARQGSTRSPRSQAPQVQILRQQEGEESCDEVRSVREGCGRQSDRSRYSGF